MKITKRIVLTIMSLLLILSVVACGKVDDAPKGGESTPPVEQNPPQEENPPSEDEEPTAFEEYKLPEELQAEIDAAFYAKYNRYPIWDSKSTDGDKYYGTYNGYAIIFSGAQTFELGEETIGKEEFIYGTGFTIYAYKDGVIDLLADVYYDQKGLTDEDIAKIAEYHRALNPLYYEDFPAQPTAELTMTAEEANAVKQAYINKYQSKDSVTVEGIHIKLYGKTDKAFVMIIESDSLDYPAVISGLTVDGLTFTFGNNNLPEVYSGGELYGLKEAFDGGILTSENLRTLYGNFTEKIFVKY